MCGSEPCRHERDSQRRAGELEWVTPTEFAGTQRDTLTSFIKTSGELVKVTAERDALRAMNEQQRATLAKIRTIVADQFDPGRVVGRIRGVLEPTPKGKP